MLTRRVPASKNITETLCDRPVREASNISEASLIGAAFAVVAFVMRGLSKVSFPCERGARIQHDFWWDDFTITIAFVLLIPITVLSNVCKCLRLTAVLTLATNQCEVTGLGIGKDVWTIPFDNLTEALKVKALPSQLLSSLTMCHFSSTTSTKSCI